MRIRSILCGLICLCLLSGCSSQPEKPSTSESETTMTAGEQVESSSSVTTEEGQSSHPTQTPQTTLSNPPTQIPQTTTSSKPSQTTTLKNIPQFIRCDVRKVTKNNNPSPMFKTSLSKSSFQLLPMAAKAPVRKLSATDTVREYVEMSDTVELNLCIANPERDTIVDVLLDDSQDGRNCLFSSSSTVYKIASIDTLWDEATSTFNTYVKIHISKCKAADLRSIQIKEINFLRQIIDQRIRGSVDMNVNANQKSFSIFCMKPLPTFETVGSYVLDEENNKYNFQLKVNDESNIITNLKVKIKSVDKTQEYASTDIKTSGTDIYDVSLPWPFSEADGDPIFDITIEYTYTRTEKDGTITKTQEVDIL